MRKEDENLKKMKTKNKYAVSKKPTENLNLKTERLLSEKKHPK